MSINLDSLKITVENVAKDRIRQGLTKACLLVEAEAKALCPKDQGILANSITHEVDGNVGYVYSNLTYAPWVELGTGLFASDNDGSLNGTGRQDPWCYFYTGKKLSKEELEYISKHGYQVFQGKQGIWRTTKGMEGSHFFYNALQNKADEIKNCF